MRRTRIHTFGASGAGTSTLAREIASRCDFTLFDADDFFWEPTDPPYQKRRDPPTRQRLLGGALAGTEHWLLAGSICGWGDAFMNLFHLAVFVTAPTELRLERLRAREQRRFGGRIAPDGDMHDQHRAFLEWAAQYDDGSLDVRSRLLHEEWLRTLSCPVLRVDGSLSVSILCDRVLAAIADTM